MNQLRHYIRTILFEETRQSLEIPVPDDLMDIYSRMKHSGKKLYLVGGAVRDALLGKTPKDYDLATDADPEKVIQILERHGRLRIDLTGKSFGVVRVRTPDDNEYEIATFRRDIGKGRRPDAVEWTGMEEDANRRDLTVNALYYDLDTKEIIDFVGGVEDVKNGVIRAVGDPGQRFDEDRLRILRVARFAARMGSTVDAETKAAILEDNELIDVTPERIKEEVMKGIVQAKSVRNFFEIIDDLNLMPQVFPGLTVSTSGVDDSSRTVGVILAQLLQGNDPKAAKKALYQMRFTHTDADQAEFLLRFADINSGTASALKKVYKRLRLTPDGLTSFAPPNISTAFIKFVDAPPAVSPRDLMAQGLEGPAIGQALQAAETELFDKLISEFRYFVRMLILEQMAQDVVPGAKVIFMAGAPGSGKSTVLRQLGLLDRFAVVNPDDWYEPFLEEHDIPMDIASFTQEYFDLKRAFKYGEAEGLDVTELEAKIAELKPTMSTNMKLFNQARKLAKEKATELSAQGKDFIIDGTGGKYNEISGLKSAYDGMGYDTAMIYISVPMETSVDRNFQRGEKGGRRLHQDAVERSHRSVSANQEPYEDLFGGNFFFVSNVGTYEDYQDNIELIRDGMQQFLGES